MKGLALALAILSAGARAEDGGVYSERPQYLEVRDGAIRVVDGELIEVNGGAYFNHTALLLTANELSTLRAENRTLKDVGMPWHTVALISVVLGGAAGFALAFAIERAN